MKFAYLLLLTLSVVACTEETEKQATLVVKQPALAVKDVKPLPEISCIEGVLYFERTLTPVISAFTHQPKTCE